MNLKTSYQSLCADAHAGSRLFLGVLGGLAAGGLAAALALHFQPIATQPVELMGSYAYFVDLPISNRLFAVRLFLIVSLAVFLALTLSPLSARMAQWSANRLDEWQAGWLRCIGEKLRALYATILNEARRENIQWLVLALLFSLAAPPAVRVLLQFLLSALLDPATLLPWLHRLNTGLRFVQAGLVCASLYLWWRRTVSGLPRLLHILQFMLLAFFLLLLPSPVNTGTAFVHALPLGRLLTLVLFLILIGAWDIARRRQRSSGTAAISPWAVFALFLGCHVFFRGNQIGSGYLPGLLTNYYELNTRLSGFWMMMNGWQSLFKDAQITYGLYDVAGMASGWLFFGEKTSFSAMIGLRILFPLALKGILFALAIRRMPMYAAFLLLFFVEGRGSIVLLCLLLLSAPALFCRPARWLIVCGCVSVFLPFACIPHGAISVLASLPAALFQLHALYRKDRGQFVTVLVFGGLLLFMVAVWPFGEHLHGYLRASIENAVVNAPWAANTFTEQFTLSDFPALLLYFIPPLLAFCVAHCLIKTQPRKRDAAFLGVLLIGFVLIYEFVAISYAFSRMDGRAFARNGQVVFAMLGVLTLFLYPFRERARMYVGFLLLLLVLSTFSGSILVMLPSLTQPALVEKTQILEDGKDFDVPNLGRGIFHSQDFLPEEKTLRGALDRVLAAEETFLDLTMEPHYFPVARKAWLEYPNYFVYPGDKPQLRSLETLAAKDIRVSLLDSSIAYDFSPVNLRAYYLYRYALLNGLPWEVTPKKTLLMPAGHFARAGLEAPDAETALRLLDQQFPERDLGRLPAVWGRGYARFQDSLGLIVDFKRASAGEKSVQWTGTFAPLRGRDAGLLLLDVKLPFRQMSLTVEWHDAGIPAGDNRVSFMAYNGINLVPLDASPRWLLADQLEFVSVETAGVDIEIKAMKLLTRPHLSPVSAPAPGTGTLLATIPVTQTRLQDYARLPKIEAGDARGNVDMFSLLEPTTNGIGFEISGWAVDKLRHSLAAEVFIEIDAECCARQYAPLEYGRRRTDVSDFFNEPNYALSGFHGTVYSNRSVGQRRVTVWAVNLDKTGKYEIGSVTIGK
jgi:hypothetical protein